MVVIMKRGIKKICGIGVNDSNHQISHKINGVVHVCRFYSTWVGMLHRCYNEKFISMHPTYSGCAVSDEWIYFSNFKGWMESQDWDGKHLDKDLLLKGNKIYSKDTCLFISSHVNNFIIENDARLGDCSLGVSINKSLGKYQAYCRSTFERRNIYLGLFDTESDAHLAWLECKRSLAFKLADSQEDERVANALRTRYL